MDQASQNLLECQDEHDFSEPDLLKYSPDISKYQDTTFSKWDSSINNNFLLTFSNKLYQASSIKQNYQSINLSNSQLKRPYELNTSTNTLNESSLSKTFYQSPKLTPIRRNLSMRLGEADISIDKSNLLLSGKHVNKVSENVLISKSKVCLGWLAESRGPEVSDQQLWHQTKIQASEAPSSQFAKLSLNSGTDSNLQGKDESIPTRGTCLISLKYEKLKETEPTIIGQNSMKGSLRKKKKIIVFPSNPIFSRRNSNSSNQVPVSPRMIPTKSHLASIGPQITLNEIMQIAQRTSKRVNKSNDHFGVGVAESTMTSSLRKSTDLNTIFDKDKSSSKTKIRPQRSLLEKKKEIEMNKVTIDPYFSPVQVRNSTFHFTSDLEQTPAPSRRRYLPRTFRSGGIHQMKPPHVHLFETSRNLTSTHTLPY